MGKLPYCYTRPGNKLINLQFQIETDETNAFREDLSIWKTCGAIANRPPSLIVEVYLDTSALTSSQSLVLLDDHKRRWDVLEALNNLSGSSDNKSRLQKRKNEVILERWTIELRDSHADRPYDFGSTLPTVYKKCIVFFRSLYTTAKFVPAWRFVKSLAKSGSSLKVSCRVLAGEPSNGQVDALTCPLHGNGGLVTTDYHLGVTETPAGQFSAEVSYRNDCNFRVDDSETLLSSRFMDEQFFKPSLAAKGIERRRSAKTTEPGSLPAHRQGLEEQEPIQAYGSMSTFHGDIPPRGSSPISALRAAKNMGSDTESPTTSAPQKPLQTSRAALAMPRRPSLSFQPFKAGSLSSSPGQLPSQNANELLSPQSPQSIPRQSGISALTQARNRSSLTAGMPATLRGGPVAQEAMPSTSSSPKPAPISRYSSSFSHRRGRLSFGGGSRLVDDDQNSSGKQSLSSSAQPGSTILAEGGTGGSSESLQTDDENISEFLKLLDSKKTLQSFERSGSTAKRTSTHLSKYKSMRESNNALTESMTSSALLHRSSSSSSRQLNSVPAMVAGTSVSAASSPGKPVSPHTPHTPAIPSRLSANSTAEYASPRRLATQIEDVVDDDQANEAGGIDIPLSPRPRQYYPHIRRSSSVAQQHRSLGLEDDLGDLPFGIHRSMSLGADDREPPSLSALLGINMAQGGETSNSPPSRSPSRSLQPAPHISENTAMSRQDSTSAEARGSDNTQNRLQAPSSLNSARWPRLGRPGGRGLTPPQGGSVSSLNDRSGSSSERGGRNSFTRTVGLFEPDDELLFDMSEIGRDRRSLDEQRGPSAGSGTYDAGRGSDSSRGRRGGW